MDCSEGSEKDRSVRIIESLREVIHSGRLPTEDDLHVFGRAMLPDDWRKVYQDMLRVWIHEVGLAHIDAPVVMRVICQQRQHASAIDLAATPGNVLGVSIADLYVTKRHGRRLSVVFRGGVIQKRKTEDYLDGTTMVVHTCAAGRFVAPFYGEESILLHSLCRLPIVQLDVTAASMSRKASASGPRSRGWLAV